MSTAECRVLSDPSCTCVNADVFVSPAVSFSKASAGPQALGRERPLLFSTQADPTLGPTVKEREKPQSASHIRHNPGRRVAQEVERVHR